jgi:hypothetical protein
LKVKLKASKLAFNCESSYLRHWARTLSKLPLFRLFNYAEVLTIAKRFEPFAKVKPTRVTLLEIGAKEFIRPVIPVCEVVNRSPIW